MKNITAILILTLIGFNVSAQVRHSYYMLGVDETCLVPTQKTLQENGTYALQFADNNLQNYFSNTPVYGYGQAFPTSENAFLKRVWRVDLANEFALWDLLPLNGVEYAEPTGNGDTELLGHTPNDYATLTGSPSMSLS